MPNHLASEKSPYLLEHAHNAVDWYPWSDEAKRRAKNDGKPILLSVGYSTCHWCHQMRKESFENERTAAFINKNFIPIKVDREERPEVDAYYMGAVQVMTGSGGWPLTVFLTPDLKPFYGGTYFPPDPRYGMPSFMQVLEFVSNLWKEKKEEVRSNTDQVLKAMAPEAGGREEEVPKSALDDGYTSLISTFDEDHGGFSRAPKFPLPATLSFLLRYHHRTGNGLARKAVLKTLDGMAAGGIRDHVGGGFHRYSTDRVWLVPHFEKMLYDNALLAKVFVEAFQLTGREEYSTVVRETLGWLRSEMKDERGGFYSAQDADTPEGEGRYYTWTPEEVESALGSRDAGTFCRLYGVTRNGNFEGRSLLHIEPGTDANAEEGGVIAGAKKALYSERIKRPRPATDSKVLTSWNGLAISAFASASTALDEGYRKDAVDAAEFLLKTNSRGGRLLRRYAGGEAAFEGTLEDYAFFVQGLLDLFEASAEPRWLKEALRLDEILLEEFEDKAGGGFYLSLDPEPVRMKEGYDGPTPSGNSVAALDLVRTAELTGDEKYRKAAERTARYFSRDLGLNPAGHTTMLSALDLAFNGAREIVITAPNAGAARGLKAEVFRSYIPDKVVVVATPDTFTELSEMSRLLEGRKPGPSARAFVCQNFECKLPADSAGALRAQLSSAKG